MGHANRVQSPLLSELAVLGRPRISHCGRRFAVVGLVFKRPPGCDDWHPVAADWAVPDARRPSARRIRVDESQRKR